MLDFLGTFPSLNRQAVVTWTNAAFGLQSATNAAGPYTTIGGATSPYTNTTSGAQIYFRLIH